MEQGQAGPAINFASTHFGDISGPTRQDTSHTYTLPGGHSFYSSDHTFATDVTHNYQSGYSNAAVTSAAVTSADLAFNRPVFVSSLENSSFPAANAVDGNSATRWSSQFSDLQWIYVDLGATFNITEVKLNWKRAAGTTYQIQVSCDAANRTTIATNTGNTTGGVHDYTGLSGAGRYVRMYGTARATSYGYSLYDFNVDGVGVAPGTTPLSRSAWSATASSTETGGDPQNPPDGGLAKRWSSSSRPGPPATGGASRN